MVSTLKRRLMNRIITINDFQNDSNNNLDDKIIMSFEQDFIKFGFFNYIFKIIKI